MYRKSAKACGMVATSRRSKSAFLATCDAQKNGTHCAKHTVIDTHSFYRATGLAV
jgi:hypothetical protein